MRFMFNFLSGRDNSVLDDARSTQSQRDITITSRLGRLGVRRANETGLIKWILTLLVDAEQKLYGKWPTYLETYNRVQIIKGFLQSMPPYEGPMVHVYPESPRDLDERIYKLAYDEKDPPVVRYVQMFEQIGGHIPLRWDNKQLQNELNSSGRGESLDGRYGRSRTMQIRGRSSLLQDLRDEFEREEIGLRFTQPQAYEDHRHGATRSSWGSSWEGHARHAPPPPLAVGWYEDNYGGARGQWGEDIHVCLHGSYQQLSVYRFRSFEL